MKLAFLLPFLLPAAVVAQPTKKVVNTLDYNQRETYYVLRDQPQLKHGPYKMEQGRAPRISLLLTGFYKQGQRDSTWTEYSWGNHRTGVGQYAQDHKVGVWQYYSYDGDTLIQQYDYSARQLRYARVTPAEKARKYMVVRGDETQELLLDRPPLYLGGQSAIAGIVGRNIRYPVQALRTHVEGRVIIDFLVDEQGRVADYRVKSGIGGGCDEEALRAVQLAPSSWLPGILAEQPVAVRMEVSVTFGIR